MCVKHETVYFKRFNTSLKFTVVILKTRNSFNRTYYTIIITYTAACDHVLDHTLQWMEWNSDIYCIWYIAWAHTLILYVSPDVFKAHDVSLRFFSLVRTKHIVNNMTMTVDQDHRANRRWPFSTSYDIRPLMFKIFQYFQYSWKRY